MKTKNITIDEYIKKERHNTRNNDISLVCLAVSILGLVLLVFSMLVFMVSSNFEELPICPEGVLFDNSCYNYDINDMHNFSSTSMIISVIGLLGSLIIGSIKSGEITIPITDKMRKSYLNEWEEHIEELKRKNESKVRLDKAKRGEL